MLKETTELSHLLITLSAPVLTGEPQVGGWSQSHDFRSCLSVFSLLGHDWVSVQLFQSLKVYKIVHCWVADMRGRSILNLVGPDVLTS